MNNCRAVSELVGTLLLISVVALAISIVSVALLSQPVPEDIPQLTALAENQSRTIYLTHTGGNALDRGEIRIIVNGIESPFDLGAESSWPWSPGENLVVTYEGPGMPEYLQLIYRGGSAEALLLTEYFVPVNITGVPTTVITTVPSTIPTTLPTTVPPPEPSCSAVIANFTANVTSGFAPLTVSFTNTSTSQDSITSWLWNFGDGSNSTSQNATHTYTNPGTYTVTLTAWNTCGNSATTSENITVSCPPVTAQFSANVTSGYPPLTVQFTDLSTSGVPIISWLWNFGDGSNSTSQNATHTYTNPGTYTVTLTAWNTCGNSATTSENITVSCPPVTAQFSANVTSGYPPLTVQFTDLSTSGVPIISWLWNFGDGSNSTSQNATHTYTNPGTYTVTLTAWNTCGNSHSMVRLSYITVMTAPPCGSISGTKYHDLNRNGRRDPGEPGLAGWTIQIFRKSGNNWIYVTSAATAADGTYIVTGLQYQPAQQYLVKEIVQPGWIRTQPATEDYYNFIVLNNGHCYEAGVEFGNWRVPATTLNTNRGGFVRNGGQVQFTVTGSNSWIKIGGATHNLNSGDSVSLSVNGDSRNVEIDMNGNHISRFAFPDVTVLRNGNTLGRGTITGIWISQYSGLTSSLSIVVPAVPSPVWTWFEYNGVTIINGNNNQRIELLNVYPRASDGFMRLDVKNTNVFYSGAATGYQLT